MNRNFFIIFISLLIGFNIQLKNDCCHKEAESHCESKCNDSCCYDEGKIVISKTDFTLPANENQFTLPPLDNCNSDYFNPKLDLDLFSNIEFVNYKELRLFHQNAQALYGNFIFYG